MTAVLEKAVFDMWIISFFYYEKIDIYYLSN